MRGKVVVDGFVNVVVGVDAVVVVVLVLVVVERATVVLLAVVVDVCTRSCDALVGGCSVSSHQLRRTLCPANAYTITLTHDVCTHLRSLADALTL